MLTRLIADKMSERFTKFQWSADVREIDVTKQVAMVRFMGNAILNEKSQTNVRASQPVCVR